MTRFDQVSDWIGSYSNWIRRQAEQAPRAQRLAICAA
jgi:hypothetical protein